MQGLRGSIPTGFPYMHVEFGLAAGFVHVIDDEAEFDPGFGHTVLKGLLENAVEDQRISAAKQGYAAQQGEADRFKAAYSEFDWTQALG